MPQGLRSTDVGKRGQFHLFCEDLVLTALGLVVSGRMLLFERAQGLSQEDISQYFLLSEFLFSILITSGCNKPRTGN